MNLEPLRKALLAEVENEARRHRAGSDDTRERRLVDAQAKADALTARGRLEGEQAAAHEALRRRAAANRRARELKLEAQRWLLDELVLRARDVEHQLRTDPRYPDLLDRLSEAAMSQLGPDAELQVDPAELGGVLGRAGKLSVDYTLPTLVRRAIRDLDGELEALWR